MARSNWGIEEWRECIFTDESTFETGKPDGALLVCLRGEVRMTAAKYVEVILCGELQKFYGEVQERTCMVPVVIEDNAPCHTAKIARRSVKGST